MTTSISNKDQSKIVGVTTDSSGEHGLNIVNLSELIPGGWDDIDITYVAAGNGTGQIYTVTYLLNTVAQATLTLSYDGSDRLMGVTKS